MFYYEKRLLFLLIQSILVLYTNLEGAHLIYYTDGHCINEAQFNHIKEHILNNYEFPKALANKDYNPEADETALIQEALNTQYHDLRDTIATNNQSATLHVRWVPDTLYDLFRYKYSQNENDEHCVNNEFNDVLRNNPQHSIESDTDYYIRLAEPLINFLLQDCDAKYDALFKCYKSQDAIELTIKQTIVVEVDQHKNNPQSVLLYRGRGSLKDFNADQACTLALYGKYAPYCLHAVGKKSIYPEMLSFGISLLSNIKHSGGACPLIYALCVKSDKGFHADADLYVVPVLKKIFMKSKNCFWFINQKYDGHQNFYGDDTRFHPRRKGITTEYIMQNIDIIEGEFKADDERVMLYKNMDDAVTALHHARTYLLHNAIGVTDYTTSKIAAAKNQYSKGKRLHNSLFLCLGYCNSLIGYEEKTWFINNLNKISLLPLIKDIINKTKNTCTLINKYLVEYKN